jgi:hypothetical protein
VDKGLSPRAAKGAGLEAGSENKEESAGRRPALFDRQAELLHGAQRSANPAGNIALVEALSIPHKSLPFDDAAAEKYGQIRSALELKGMTIGANDY